MNRHTALALILALPVSASAASAESRKSVSVAIARLQDPAQSVRDSAAKEIQETLKLDPTAAYDLGEQYWKKQFEAVKPGMTMAEIRKVTGAPDPGPGMGGMGACSGGSCTISYRLDDYWNVTLFTSTLGKGLLGVNGFSRFARYVWVEPPKNYSGKWVTYFVNGLPSHEIQYSDGRYRLFKKFHDNGLLSVEQKYPDGQIDGPEIGRYPDGRKSYEGSYSGGKRAGVWVHWYPNGKKQLEEIYYSGGTLRGRTSWHENGVKSLESKYGPDGKETEQAAWKEDGSLAYAHGSLEGAKGQ